MKGISIIIPVWNEEKNIKLLVEKIDNALRLEKLTYEIIFIDDHSTDSTRTVINQLIKFYPIKLFLKKGKQGKAYSLMEGFAYAKYDLLGMIDADLQYLPSHIPQMIRK